MDRLFLALIISAAAVACSPKVKTTKLAEFPPQTADHPIRVYAEKQPSCDYDEVAIIEVSKKYYAQSMDAVTNKLREEARKLGGDAVVSAATGRADTGEGVAVPTGSGWITQEGGFDAIRGIVIRYSDPECRE